MLAFSPFFWLIDWLFFVFLFSYFFQSIFLKQRKDLTACNPGTVGTLLKKGVRTKVYNTSIFGVLDKPSQSTYNNMLDMVKISHNEQQIIESNNGMFCSIIMDIIIGSK